MLRTSNRHESVATVACSLEVAEAAEPEDDEMNEGSVKDGSFGLAKVEDFPLVGHLAVA